MPDDSTFRTIGFTEFTDAESFMRRVTDAIGSASLDNEWYVDCPGRVVHVSDDSNWMQAVQIEAGDSQFWIISDSDSDLPGNVMEPDSMAYWLELIGPKAFTGRLVPLENREDN